MQLANAGQDFVPAFHLYLSLTALKTTTTFFLHSFSSFCVFIISFLFRVFNHEDAGGLIQELLASFASPPHTMVRARGEKGGGVAGADLNPTENIVGHATKLIRLRPQSTRRQSGDTGVVGWEDLGFKILTGCSESPHWNIWLFGGTFPHIMSLLNDTSTYPFSKWPLKTSTGLFLGRRPQAATLAHDARYRCLLAMCSDEAMVVLM